MVDRTSELGGCLVVDCNGLSVDAVLVLLAQVSDWYHAHPALCYEHIFTTRQAFSTSEHWGIEAALSRLCQQNAIRRLHADVVEQYLAAA